jgi:hypothetical protein
LATQDELDEFSKLSGIDYSNLSNVVYFSRSPPAGSSEDFIKYEVIIKLGDEEVDEIMSNPMFFVKMNGNYFPAFAKKAKIQIVEGKSYLLMKGSSPGSKMGNIKVVIDKNKNLSFAYVEFALLRVDFPKAK